MHAVRSVGGSVTDQRLPTFIILRGCMLVKPSDREFFGIFLENEWLKCPFHLWYNGLTADIIAA